MSKAARKLVAYAPDGTEVSCTTSGGYDIAGLARHSDGHWSRVAWGTSAASVAKRARASARRNGYTATHTGPLYEESAPVIRAYFGTHAVVVHAVFQPGTGGWQAVRYRDAGKSMLRALALAGVTAVAIRQRDSNRTADFPMSQIARSCQFRLPQRAAGTES